MRNETGRLSSDEVDLLVLIRGIWRQKLLVFIVTALAVAVAVSYALLATPVYEAKAFIQPPTNNEIVNLNYGRGGEGGLKLLSAKDVYEVYLSNLTSESLRRQFFREQYLPYVQGARNGSRDDLYVRFNTQVVATVAKDGVGRSSVSVLLNDPEVAAGWVDEYLKIASERAKLEIIGNVRADATIKVGNLQQQISEARKSAQKQREDRIAQLNEALRVAKSIGLERPPIISNSISTEITAGMTGSLAYMRGSKALEAEIENLRQRTSDDPFVDDLREWQEQLEFYRTLHVDPQSIDVYRQDGAIQMPDAPIKPKKAIIITLGAIFGLLLGVLIACVRTLLLRDSPARLQ
ncbi:Chain length determinant protein [Pseudomonas reidholzensis]|uniref:Chain length determinant protein n=1 Tax=Pseudomonas reidholzensis TaxID=1785162 RepID=A0A383RQS9_9PSED|nr:Wzz/FepE/Etk N-terminal domain-containing protein [Pseudomonas reidholzensis]SYX89420.1 Chain length determinant protein [Pseudomonas reidholzensis]